MTFGEINSIGITEHRDDWFEIEADGDYLLAAGRDFVATCRAALDALAKLGMDGPSEPVDWLRNELAKAEAARQGGYVMAYSAGWGKTWRSRWGEPTR